MENKIYWTGIEYNYDEKSNDLKGGFVYAFVKSFDVREALEKVLKALKEEKLVPLDIEFVSPYDEEMEWETEEQTKQFLEMYEDAKNTEDVIFDDFYAYESDLDIV